MGNLVSQPFCGFFVILILYADQQEKARINFSVYLAVNRDGGFRYALYYYSHIQQIIADFGRIGRV